MTTPAPALEGMTSPFVAVRLRTTDTDAAGHFYGRVLGPGARALIDAIPADSAARGARPIWLGVVGTTDPGATAAQLQALGAMRLGPPVSGANNQAVSLWRDAGGAVFGLAGSATSSPDAAAATPTDGSATPRPVWQHLNCPVPSAASAMYRGAFGWRIAPSLERSNGLSVWPVCARDGAAPFASLVDVSGLPDVHPHWLFHFEVPALDAALATVRAEGGTVGPVSALPNGRWLAICDDPQGAAFGLQSAQR